MGGKGQRGRKEKKQIIGVFSFQCASGTLLAT